MLAVNIPRNHSKVHVWTCHRPRTILTFLQNVTYHVDTSVCDLMYLLRGGEAGVGVKGEKAAKAVSTV